MRASILALGACAALVSGPAIATASSTSWGKVDVPFTQYRADSQSCAEQGLDTALQQHAGNWESQGIQNSPEDYLRTFQSRSLEKRHAQITEGQSALDDCLIRLGYRKFRLTEAQHAHLNTLAPGSDARQKYLYSLASDPAVLAAQGF